MARKKSEKTEEKSAEVKQSKKPVKDDLASLKERVEKLKIHLSKNKHDYKTKRTLSIKQAKILKLEKYRAK